MSVKACQGEVADRQGVLSPDIFCLWCCAASDTHRDTCDMIRAYPSTAGMIYQDLVPVTPKSRGLGRMGTWCIASATLPACKESDPEYHGLLPYISHGRVEIMRRKNKFTCLFTLGKV